LRQLDFHGEELRLIDAELGRVALPSGEVRRLMTIPGVAATVALWSAAGVGDFARFSSRARPRSPRPLIPYLAAGVSNPSSGRHMRFSDQLARPIAYSLQEEQHADPG
jgi:hypothetical protein